MDRSHGAYEVVGRYQLTERTESWLMVRRAGSGGDVREYSLPEGEVVLIGQCLASVEQLRNRIRQALVGDALPSLMSLPGSYSVILVRPDRSVLLAADLSRQFPLYLSRTGHVLHFGSRASSVAALTDSVPNLIALAAEIVVPPVIDVLGARTSFRGVEQLEAGTSVLADSTGVRRRTLASSGPIDGKTVTEGAEELRDCLSLAVAARAEAAELLSADFSGGLDSTSLAFLATRHTDLLPSYTYVQDQAPVEDDVWHAMAYARLEPRIDHHVVRGSVDQLPYQEANCSDEPRPSALMMGPVVSRMSAAASRGAEIHLVGEGGDHVLAAPHSYLVDLAQRGDLTTLWRHCWGWARLRNRAPVTLFARAVLSVRETRASGLRAMAYALRTANRSHTSLDSWEFQAITAWRTPVVSWLAPRAQHLLVDHLLRLADEEQEECAVGDRMAHDLLRSAGRTQQVIREAGARCGVAVHAPFLDTEVVRVCLSIPARRKGNPLEPKVLLRQAMAGLVPDAVLSRRTKGDYTRAAYLGVRRSAQVLAKLLENPICAEIGLIEPRQVRKALARATQGLPVPWGALNQVLATEFWLREITFGTRRDADAGIHDSARRAHDNRT